MPTDTTPTARAPVTAVEVARASQSLVDRSFWDVASNWAGARTMKEARANALLMERIVAEIIRANHPPAAEREAPGGAVDEIVTRLYRRFKDWSKHGFGPDDVTWCEVKADVIAMLDAAPPPPANIGGDSPSEREAALRTVRQQLAAYTAAHPEEQELRRFLEKWDAILAIPAAGGGQ